MSPRYDWSTVDPADPYAMPEPDFTLWRIEQHAAFAMRSHLGVMKPTLILSEPFLEVVPLTAMTWPG